MKQKPIGIDIIKSGLSAAGLDIHPTGNQYVVTSEYSTEHWRFENYKQLKAFYLGYMAAKKLADIY